MKKVTLALTLVILLLLMSLPVSAAKTTLPGTFFTEEQADKAREIQSLYGVQAIFLYSEKSIEEIGKLSDLANTFLAENNITEKYCILAENEDYYYFDWSVDLDEVFHSDDGGYIVNAISYAEDYSLLSPRERVDNYYDLLAVMLANRTNCPYTYIKDQAGVLTDDEEKALNDTLTAYHDKTGCDLVIVMTNGVDPDDRMAFADDYYDYHGYGKDGALLLVNIGEDDVYSRGNSWISTSGSYIDLISDDDIDDIGSELTPLLLEGKFYDAADRFVVLVDRIIVGQRVAVIGVSALAACLICVIVAFIYCGKLKAQLKSVQNAADANDYIVDNSLNITQSYDHFLYSHVTKTAKESKRSGGSSSHTSSSGSSHGGGGF